MATIIRFPGVESSEQAERLRKLSGVRTVSVPIDHPVVAAVREVSERSARAAGALHRLALGFLEDLGVKRDGGDHAA